MLSFNSNWDTIVQHGRRDVMENCPPYHLAPHTSLMHPRSNSKSSPTKRDATRVLTPQYNHAVAPTDPFETGLLTPQASQNTFDSDAATSLISPPPEDSARPGITRQSVRVALPVLDLTYQHNITSVLMDKSWFHTNLEFASRCKQRQFIQAQTSYFSFACFT